MTDADGGGLAPAAPPAPGRRRALLLLPLLMFLALAGLFYARLGAGDPSALPSALIGRPAPADDLGPLDGLNRDGKPVPGLSGAAFRDGRVTIVNVFASWCGPCREEHPLLLKLAQDPRVRLVAINYKDDPENARRFLGALGNPYAAVGVDPKGRAAIDWGVYGVPETFLVGPDGTILTKVVGPLSEASIAADLEPRIRGAAAGFKDGATSGRVAP
jgi:cytochrome c biogenesis protein CcmG/thiol:disulfide interchange protein DsbE